MWSAPFSTRKKSTYYFQFAGGLFLHSPQIGSRKPSQNVGIPLALTETASCDTFFVKFYKCRPSNVVGGPSQSQCQPLLVNGGHQHFARSQPAINFPTSRIDCRRRRFRQCLSTLSFGRYWASRASWSIDCWLEAEKLVLEYATKTTSCMNTFNICVRLYLDHFS